MRISDWSSDVCSSDLQFAAAQTMASRLNEDLGTPDDPLASILHKSAANVTNPAKELEARVRAKDPSKHIGHDGNPVLTWMVSNAVVTRHVNGTIIPKKESPERSEEHTSELQSLMRISYAVFCLT